MELIAYILAAILGVLVVIVLMLGMIYYQISKEKRA